MAYTEKLNTTYCDKASCDSGAVLKVYKDNNILVGRYCYKHGRIKYKEVSDSETGQLAFKMEEEE